MMTFHGKWFREKFGKLGMVCIAGPPNIAKTSSLKVAMHLASSSSYFFSMKVGSISENPLSPVIAVLDNGL